MDSTNVLMISLETRVSRPSSMIRRQNFELFLWTLGDFISDRTPPSVINIVYGQAKVAPRLFIESEMPIMVSTVLSLAPRISRRSGLGELGCQETFRQTPSSVQWRSTASTDRQLVLPQIQTRSPDWPGLAGVWASTQTRRSSLPMVLYILLGSQILMRIR
jgi:hypothetical protein